MAKSSVRGPASRVESTRAVVIRNLYISALSACSAGGPTLEDQLRREGKGGVGSLQNKTSGPFKDSLP
jgi:hypothetical protein